MGPRDHRWCTEQQFGTSCAFSSDSYQEVGLVGSNRCTPEASRQNEWIRALANGQARKFTALGNSRERRLPKETWQEITLQSGTIEIEGQAHDDRPAAVFFFVRSPGDPYFWQSAMSCLCRHLRLTRPESNASLNPFHLKRLRLNHAESNA